MMTVQDLRQTISRFVDGGRKRRQLKRELAQLHLAGVGYGPRRHALTPVIREDFAQFIGQ